MGDHMEFFGNILLLLSCDIDSGTSHLHRLTISYCLPYLTIPCGCGVNTGSQWHFLFEFFPMSFFFRNGFGGRPILRVI